MAILELLVSACPPLWACLLYLWGFWRLHRFYQERWKLKERKNVSTVGSEAWLAAPFLGLSYLWRGPDMLLENYRPGIPLAIRTPETYYIHFSASHHMRELMNEPHEKLSLHAVTNDMFTPKHTMNGLELQDNMKANGSLHLRVYGVVLRSHLPELCSPLSQILGRTFDREVTTSTTHDKDGWARLPSLALTKRVITAANALVFFGPDLAANPTFLEAALAYPENVFFAGEVLRLVPSFLHPILAPPLMRNHQASKTMVSHLMPVVEHRLRRARDGQGADPRVVKPRDCIQFFVDANATGCKDDWTARKIVQVLLGTWFAAIHQPALTAVYILEHLCEHAEYVQHIRQELAPHLGSRPPSDAPDGLYSVSSTAAAAAIENAPLLDAFLKESSRLHPSDSISVRRKALEPFTFRDGTHILPGDVACVPSQAIMRDETIYSHSTVFSPSRFLTNGEACIKDKEQGSFMERGSQSRFHDAELTYPLWGLGRHTCPGRFYASLILKLLVAHVVTHYDIRLSGQAASRTFHFRSCIIPKPSSSLLFRRRDRR